MADLPAESFLFLQEMGSRIRPKSQETKSFEAPGPCIPFPLLASSSHLQDKRFGLHLWSPNVFEPQELFKNTLWGPLSVNVRSRSSGGRYLYIFLKCPPCWG